MTNPVILLGTQSNGETLPVQVNSLGQLVTEGLTGGEGPQGPEGPEGPQGPPGENGQGVPLNGSEGDVLTWIDGEPTWVGKPNDGVVWPDQLTAEGGWLPGFGSENAFDGTSSEASTSQVGGSVSFAMPVAMQLLSFAIKTNNGDTSAQYSYQYGGISGSVDDSGAGGGWMYFNRLAGQQFEAGDAINFRRVSDAMRTNIKFIELNGEQLFYDVSLRKIIRREVVRALIEVRKES